MDVQTQYTDHCDDGYIAVIHTLRDLCKSSANLNCAFNRYKNLEKRTKITDRLGGCRESLKMAILSIWHVVISITYKH